MKQESRLPRSRAVAPPLHRPHLLGPGHHGVVKWAEPSENILSLWKMLKKKFKHGFGDIESADNPWSVFRETNFETLQNSP